MISLLLALNLLIHSVGWCRRKAPMEPKYPSCRKKYACFVPLLQNFIAYDNVFIVIILPTLPEIWSEGATSNK